MFADLPSLQQALLCVKKYCVPCQVLGISSRPPLQPKADCRHMAAMQPLEKLQIGCSGAAVRITTRSTDEELRSYFPPDH